MKKAALAMVLMSALLFSSAELVRTAEANAYWWYTHVDPVPGTIPPSITVYNPQNNTDYSTDNLTLDFSVSPPKLMGWSPGLSYVSSSIDGRPLQQMAYLSFQGDNEEPAPSTFNLTLPSVNTGSHRLTIEALVRMLGAGPSVFSITCNSTIFITRIDAEPPSISVLSPNVKTVYTGDVPLDFAIDEPASEISYILDARGNVSIARNTTLTGLAKGAHNITIYAWDATGNVGASETITFTIAEPFPSALIIGSVVAVVASLGLLVYLKKRKH